MSPELQKQIFDRIDALAAKLGVAAQYLWGVMVRQSYVEGFTFLLIHVAWLLCLWRFMKGMSETGKGRSDAFTDYQATKVVVFGIFAVLGLIFFAFSILPTMTDLFNPGYAALGHMREVFTGN